MDPSELPLRDLHLPEAVSWWPLALGWWFVLAVATGLLIWILRRAYDKWRANAPRRFAVRELGNIENDFLQHGNAVLMAQKVSELLRRSMLGNFHGGGKCHPPGLNFLKHQVKRHDLGQGSRKTFGINFAGVNNLAS